MIKRYTEEELSSVLTSEEMQRLKNHFSPPPFTLHELQFAIHVRADSSLKAEDWNKLSNLMRLFITGESRRLRTFWDWIDFQYDEITSNGFVPSATTRTKRKYKTITDPAIREMRIRSLAKAREVRLSKIRARKEEAPKSESDPIPVRSELE